MWIVPLYMLFLLLYLINSFGAHELTDNGDSIPLVRLSDPVSLMLESSFDGVNDFRLLSFAFSVACVYFFP